MKNIDELFLIKQISEEHVEGFNAAVGAVAREKKYLAFLDSPSLESSRDFVRKMIEANMPSLVALANDKVIGWCDISPLDRPVFAHSGCLGIGIIQGYRNLGLGENLIRQALALAIDRGLTRVELTVRENNKSAIHLYKKIGFVAEGLHINAVKIDDRYENHVSMAILL